MMLSGEPDSSFVYKGLCATLSRYEKIVTPAGLLLLFDAMRTVVPGTT